MNYSDFWLSFKNNKGEHHRFNYKLNNRSVVMFRFKYPTSDRHPPNSIRIVESQNGMVINARVNISLTNNTKWYGI